MFFLDKKMTPIACHTLKAAFFLAHISLLGCTVGGITRLTEDLPAPKSGTCQQDMYLDESHIAGKIARLCRINSRDTPRPWNPGEIAVALKNASKMACNCGADGIYIENINPSENNMTVIAFRYEDQETDRTSALNLEAMEKNILCKKDGGQWLNGKCEARMSQPSIRTWKR